MWVLIGALVFFGVLLMVLTYFNRRNKDEEPEIVVNNDGECCGAHAVCERDSLLSKNDKVEYFDDEELDVLSGVEPQNFTGEQIKQLSDVFYTLKESEVAAWLRSLQMRRIELPMELRDEALMIVSERRSL
ncbi:MAG: phospholipase [Paludibacter sp.]|nr:phospholipase [Paludibacter sp.]